MKRLLQIGKELNIGLATLIDYCERLGYISLSPHSKIHSEIESQIIELHNNRIVKPTIIQQGEFEVSSLSELPVVFNQNNPFQLEQHRLLSEGDIFSHRQKRTLYFEDSKVETVFSDFEANSICMGLDDRHFRHIARKYFNTNEQLADEQIEVHSIAMKALEKYGGKALLFFISLPPLPFKAVNATQIFSELDKRRNKQEFPILRISFRNVHNQIEKIQIAYYAEKSKVGRIRFDDVLSVKNRSTGQQLFCVSRGGYVVPERNAKEIIPVLQVFVRFSTDTTQAFLNYGLETGECAICGRELTDPESIRLGIGPICRKDL
jgi:hypothetical protein